MAKLAILRFINREVGRFINRKGTSMWDEEKNVAVSGGTQLYLSCSSRVTMAVKSEKAKTCSILIT